MNLPRRIRSSTAGPPPVGTCCYGCCFPTHSPLQSQTRATPLPSQRCPSSGSSVHLACRGCTHAGIPVPAPSQFGTEVRLPLAWLAHRQYRFGGLTANLLEIPRGYEVGGNHPTAADGQH
jgi:hypothetical protein